MRNLNLILAVDEEGGFGKDGKIPWNIPEDLKHFQTTTKNSICIMGKRTYEDIKEMKVARGGKSKELLAGRECYVISSTLGEVDDATVVDSIRHVSDYANKDKPMFVIGGERLFIEALSFTTKVYMTIVEGTYDCDRFFPVDVLEKHFEIETGEEINGLKFMVYKRR